MSTFIRQEDELMRVDFTAPYLPALHTDDENLFITSDNDNNKKKARGCVGRQKQSWLTDRGSCPRLAPYLISLLPGCVPPHGPN